MISIFLSVYIAECTVEATSSHCVFCCLLFLASLCLLSICKASRSRLRKMFWNTVFLYDVYRLTIKNDMIFFTVMLIFLFYSYFQIFAAFSFFTYSFFLKLLFVINSKFLFFPKIYQNCWLLIDMYVRTYLKYVHIFRLYRNYERLNRWEH